MRILKFLFGDKTPVEQEVNIPELGALIWDEDEESWKGNCNGVEILLSIEKSMVSPSPELIKYAVSILKNEGMLISALEEEKQKYLNKYPKASNEVSALKYSSIMFYRYKSKFNRIIASLEPGEDFRAWRIEFSGTNCEGLGFDS